MGKTIEQLEGRRDGIYQQMAALGDFRPGMVSVNYRKCGKPNCVCAGKGHPGHGPQYLWNTTQNGKSRAQNLRLGPELEKAEREIANYKKFGRLCQEAIGVNEALCLLRPVPEIHEEDKLEALKKKLRRRFFKKRSGKLT
jgi:hypothetical protein